MPNAAVIYARISQDRAGEGLGVKRQLTDCRSEVPGAKTKTTTEVPR